MKKSYETTRLMSILALALTTAACEHPGAWPYRSGPDAGAGAPGMFTTDAPRYESGSVVTLHLTNRTPRSLGYNLCRSSIELERDGDWQPTQPMLAEACTAELRTLRPGQTISYSFRIVQKRRGQYRVSTDVEDPQTRSRSKIVSTPFTLTRDESD